MFFWYGHEGEYQGVGCSHCQRTWYSTSIADKLRKVVGATVRTFVETQDFPTDATEESEHADIQQTLEEYADQQTGTTNYDWMYQGKCAPAPREPVHGIHPAELVDPNFDRSCDREPYCPCPHDVTWADMKGDTRCDRCGMVLERRLA